MGKSNQVLAAREAKVARLPRVLALLHFTQSIFLLFAAVYIAKESIEQVLLGSGAHAHTHSHGHALEPAVPHALSEGPEQARGFPHFLLGLAATMSLCAGVGLGNHQKLVDAVGPLFLPDRMARIGGALGLRVMGNPFTLAVTGGSMAVLAGSLFVPMQVALRTFRGVWLTGAGPRCTRWTRFSLCSSPFWRWRCRSPRPEHSGTSSSRPRPPLRAARCRPSGLRCVISKTIGGWSGSAQCGAGWSMRGTRALGLMRAQVGRTEKGNERGVRRGAVWAA